MDQQQQKRLVLGFIVGTTILGVIVGLGVLLMPILEFTDWLIGFKDNPGARREATSRILWPLVPIILVFVLVLFAAFRSTTKSK